MAKGKLKQILSFSQDISSHTFPKSDGCYIIFCFVVSKPFPVIVSFQLLQEFKGFFHLTIFGKFKYLWMNNNLQAQMMSTERRMLKLPLNLAGFQNPSGFYALLVT